MYGLRKSCKISVNRGTIILTSQLLHAQQWATYNFNHQNKTIISLYLVSHKFLFVLLCPAIMKIVPSTLISRIFGKISAQPHTVVKQICFPNGNLLFLSFFSLSKNWMHDIVWGCAEILPNLLGVIHVRFNDSNNLKKKIELKKRDCRDFFKKRASLRNNLLVCPIKYLYLAKSTNFSQHKL